MKSKLKIIQFCGTDGSGKTTVINAFNKATKYEFFCVDRLFDSAYVYDFVYKRRKRETLILRAEEELSNLENVDFFCVYLFCEKDDLYKRLIEKGEPARILKNIDRASKKYTEYMSKSNFKMLLLNTSNTDVEECVKKITQFVRSRQ